MRFDQRQSDTTACLQKDMKGFKVALLFYKADAGDFPTTAQGLMAMVEKPSLEPIPKRFTQRMKEVPSDPWGNPYVYRWPAAEGDNFPEISSFGPDGEADTADDIVHERRIRE